MICFTSLSPNHTNNERQKTAIKSWLDLGLRVYSMNGEKEVEALKSLYPEVNFVTTNRTMELTYGKPYVNVNAILDYCKQSQEDYFVIINSDIELRTDRAMIEKIKNEMHNSIVMANRMNYDEGKEGIRYLMGIDVFFIHKRFLGVYPQTMHCLGMTFVDYFFSYIAIKSGVPCIFLEQNIAYHKNHPAQYSGDDWRKSGRFFLWETSLYQFDDTTGIGKMSTFVYNFIYNSSKRKLI